VEAQKRVKSQPTRLPQAGPVSPIKGHGCRYREFDGQRPLLQEIQQIAAEDGGRYKVIASGKSRAE